MDWPRGLYIPNAPTEPDKVSLLNPAAPLLLPLQHVGVLPFAMSMIKAALDGGGTEPLTSQAEKNPNTLLVNSRLCQCIADGEDVGLSCPSHIWHTSGGQCCAIGAGWCGRARAPASAQGHPRVLLSADACSHHPCRAALHLLFVNPQPDTTDPLPALPSPQDHDRGGKSQHHTAKPEPWGLWWKRAMNSIQQVAGGAASPGRCSTKTFRLVLAWAETGQVPTAFPKALWGCTCWCPRKGDTSTGKHGSFCPGLWQLWEQETLQTIVGRGVGREPFVGRDRKARNLF